MYKSRKRKHRKLRDEGQKNIKIGALWNLERKRKCHITNAAGLMDSNPPCLKMIKRRTQVLSGLCSVKLISL